MSTTSHPSPPTGRRPSSRRARQFKVLVPLAALALGLGAVEVLFRVRPTPLTYLQMRNVLQQQCTRPDPLLQFANREGYRGEFRNVEFRTTVAINGKGLRDRDYPHEKPAGRKRYLVLGDSFAMGWGVEADETLAERLEGSLAGVEVLNAGCSGWSTRQEWDWLREEGFRYAPDGVLLLFCPNDPAENDVRYRFVRGRLMRADEGEGIVATAGRLLMKNSVTCILAGRVLQKLGLSRTDAGAPSVDRVWKVETRLLSEMAGACRSRGVRLAVAYVPGKAPGGRPEHQEGFENLRDWAGAEKVPLLDLTGPLTEADRRDRVYFRLDDHWTPHGHAAAAAAAERLLRQNGWLEPSGSPATAPPARPADAADAEGLWHTNRTSSQALPLPPVRG